MLLCPELVNFTCTATNLDSTLLRWSRDGGIDITALDHTYSDQNQYPFTVPISSDVKSDGFISLKIQSVDPIEGTRNFNYTANLLVDMEMLFNAGYRSLQCGSSFESSNFSFSELDIEGSYNNIIQYNNYIVQ